VALPCAHVSQSSSITEAVNSHVMMSVSKTDRNRCIVVSTVREGFLLGVVDMVARRARLGVGHADTPRASVLIRLRYSTHDCFLSVAVVGLSSSVFRDRSRSIVRRLRPSKESFEELDLFGGHGAISITRSRPGRRPRGKGRPSSVSGGQAGVICDAPLPGKGTDHPIGCDGPPIPECLDG
jgi:hypothetical protein